MTPAELVARRTRFISRIHRALDEQRIDIVIAAAGEANPDPVVASAKRTGLLLARV